MACLARVANTILHHSKFNMTSLVTPAPESISVVIVNYNSGHFLTECVKSAMPQAGEVIVVDNASADASLALCEAAFPDEPKLKFIRNQSNLGFARACNIGAKATQAAAILFLNPDCNLRQDAVSEMMNALYADPGAGMAGGFLMNPDGTEQGGGRRAVPTPWRSFVRAFGLGRLAVRWPRLFSDFYLHNQPLPPGPVMVEAISGACMLVKKEAIDQVGLWDEAYFLHCEDLDWCMRFRRQGWKILFVPSAKVEHAYGVCGAKRPIFVEWHKHKGMIRFYRKFFHHQYPGALMWLVALGVWLRFALVACVYLLRRFRRGGG